jgi:hypothetical protein
MRKKITTKEFIERAKDVHGDKYIYNKTEYINSKADVKIYCKKHEDFFWQRPSHHLDGHGCGYCAGKKKLTNREFVRKAKEIHKNRYGYEYISYDVYDTPIKIFCKKHEEFFYQKPHDHLRGAGCSKCGLESSSKKQSKSQGDFIKEAVKIHKDKYSYDNVKYINARSIVEIICLKHFSFFQTPDNHLRGQGCPVCHKKGESEVGEILKTFFKDWNICSQKKIWSSFRSYSKDRFCDFWLEKDEIKIMVEYDGEQHFKPVRFNGMSFKKAEKEFKKTQIKDELDKQFCEENNIILHRIKYDEDKEKSIKNLKYLLTGEKND